ncbi:MAG: hypothetical protein L6420_09040 [Elusimicrobia bacterium]|nr:hypothetical protein [Elusimicrobiota bacterium]
MENKKILIIQFQLTRFKALALLTAFFICFHPKILGCEQLTLTTYYPSPYGGYAKLLTTDQTVLARDSGNVGIGIATPAGKLHVEGAGNVLFNTSGRVGIKEVNPARTLHIGGTDAVRGQISLTQAGSVATDSTAGIYWHAGDAYGIYREAGAWSNPYPDLRIAFHTGIKFGANASYNGMRFYSDYNMASLVMSVNDASTGGAGNVYMSGILTGMCTLRDYTVAAATTFCAANERVFALYGDGWPRVVGFLPASGEGGGVGSLISLGQDWNGQMLCCRIQ